MGRAEHEPTATGNVGSNTIYSGQELIDTIRPLITVHTCPRSLEGCALYEPVIAGNISKFNRCGWTAEIGLKQTIHDMVAWWRNYLALAAAKQSAPQEVNA